MKLAVRILLVLILLFGAGAAVYKPVTDYFRNLNQIQYRTAEISRGEIVAVVNSTGTVRPVETVQVGSFVSGPIQDLFVDYNVRVKKGDLLARVDPRIYDANLRRDKATLLTRMADVQRVQALLSLAERDKDRAERLRKENKDFISQAEIDQLAFNRDSLTAQLALAKAAVEQSEGSLEFTKLQLSYTDITAPCDGVIIDCKVRSGQTLAAQFQTPELFTIAPNMEEKMHVLASVDEADIGLIRTAQEHEQPVRFTVDAYPDDLFEGVIEQVRMSSTTTQSVVTYPVVVAAANPELKLLPGMTASLSFQIESREDVLRVPNAAIRFYPDINQVRPEDRGLLDGSLDSSADADSVEVKRSADERAAAGRARHKRHVWVVENGLLKAVAIVTGISDGKFTELIGGDLVDGQALVTGILPPAK